MDKLFLILIFIFLTGCTAYKPAISDRAKYDLEKPIDCSRAQEDINILEQEKVDVSAQAKAGVKMFVPAAAARSILHGDYRERKEVATGEYNQAIDDKITQIKENCGEKGMVLN